MLVLHVVLNDYGNPERPRAVLTQMRMSGWNVFGTDAVVVIVGVLIGSAGSAVGHPALPRRLGGPSAESGRPFGPARFVAGACIPHPKNGYP